MQRLPIRSGWLLILFASGAALGHHGVSGQFDLSVEFEITGTVTRVAWVNPHSYVYFDVSDESGATEQWRCELRAATTLRRSGWTRDMFAPGTKVTIFGSPARREDNACYTQYISFNDGPRLYRYAQLNEDQEAVGDNGPGVAAPARLANGEPNISGDWAADQRLFSHDEILRFFGRPLKPGQDNRPRLGRRVNVELTEAGQQAASERAGNAGDVSVDDEGLLLQTGSGSLNCQPRSFFRDWTFDQHPNRITQEGERITLQYGFMDTTRTIYLDMSEHPEDLKPSPVGHSIGRWEDDVLVVETTGFSAGPFPSPAPNTVRSDAYRVSERFELNEDGTMLMRSWTAEDPAYWTNSVSGQDAVRRSDIEWEPYNCDDRTNENVRN